MYSIVQVGGHQYKVQAGDVIDVQKLSQEIGEEISFDKVLFVGGESYNVGAPFLSGASVKAKVVRQARSRKVTVYKRKPGKYRKKNSHRQHYTALLITELNSGSGESSAIDKESKNAKKYL